MQFTAATHVNLPQDRVFQIVSDTSIVERAAAKKNVDVRRKFEGPATEGAQWDADFSFRDKQMSAVVTLSEISAPDRLVFLTVTDGIEARATLDVVADGPERTRLALVMDLTGKSMTAKFMLQSLKLAKGRVDDKLQKNFDKLGPAIERIAGQGVA